MVIMRNFLAIISLCYLLTSCASVPPPRIENGLYINPKFQYSIKLPAGWMEKETIPAWFEKEIDSDLKGKIQISFYNNETNGAIIVVNDKTFLDLKNINKKQLSNAIESKLKSEIEDVRKKPYIEKINYTIYEPASILEPSLVSVTEGEIVTEFMRISVENNSYIYTCEDDDTCVFSVILISLSRTFEENKKIYKEIIRSLEKRDY